MIASVLTITYKIKYRAAPRKLEETNPFDHIDTRMIPSTSRIDDAYFIHKIDVTGGIDQMNQMRFPAVVRRTSEMGDDLIEISLCREST